MANRARGETVINVPNVGDVTLCLTLAGMAALEDAFEVDNIQDAIGKVQSNPSSTGMATVIAALTLGGDKEYSAEEVRKWRITPAQIREATAAMNAGQEDEAGDEGNAPPAKKAPAKGKR